MWWSHFWLGAWSLQLQSKAATRCGCSITQSPWVILWSRANPHWIWSICKISLGYVKPLRPRGLFATCHSLIYSGESSHPPVSSLRARPQSHASAHTKVISKKELIGKRAISNHNWLLSIINVFFLCFWACAPVGPGPQWQNCLFPVGGFPSALKALSVLGELMLPFPHRKKHISFFPCDANNLEKGPALGKL